MLTACADATEWSSGMVLLHKMKSFMVQPSEMSQNLVLSVDKFSWPLALEGFGGIQTRRMAQNQISCNAAVTCCEKSSQWTFAINLLHYVRKEQSSHSSPSFRRLNPGVVSVSAAISACEKGGQWNMALLLLKSVEFLFDGKAGKVNTITYNAAISASEKSSKWQFSESLLAEIQQISLESTEITYNAVISACHRAYPESLLMGSQDALTAL